MSNLTEKVDPATTRVVLEVGPGGQVLSYSAPIPLNVVVIDTMAAEDPDEDVFAWSSPTPGSRQSARARIYDPPNKVDVDNTTKALIDVYYLGTESPHHLSYRRFKEMRGLAPPEVTVKLAAQRILDSVDDFPDDRHSVAFVSAAMDVITGPCDGDEFEGDEWEEDEFEDA